MEKFWRRRTQEKPKEDPTLSEQENSAEELSRRELFRRGGKILGGAVAAEILSHFESSSAFAAEILKEGSELRKGMETFVKNVFENDNEISGFVSVRKKGGKWYGITEGDMEKVSVSGDTVVRSLGKIAKEKGVEVFGEVHTHPLSYYGEDAYTVPVNLGEAELAEMKIGKRPLLSHPPSMKDIQVNQRVTLGLWKDFHLDPAQFFSAVFDPRGVWQYHVTGSRFKEILEKRRLMSKRQTMLRDKVAHIPQDGVNSIFDRLRKRDGGINTNLLFLLPENDTSPEHTASEEKQKRTTILSYLYGEDGEVTAELLTEEEKDLQEKGLDIEVEFHSLEEKWHEAGNAFMIKSLKGDLTEEDYAALSQTYADLGTTLTFKSYQSLGLSYKNLHKR